MPISLISSFCTSGQMFAASFLQIPTLDGHPCSWLYTSRYRACYGLAPLRECSCWANTKKSRPANADLLGAENETRARVRGHGATSFVVPSAGPAGSSLGERVASSSPLYKKSRPAICWPAWSGKRDSNSRPQPWQGCALPTELFPHFLLRTVILKNGLQR